MRRTVRLILLSVLALALTASVTAFADDSRTGKPASDDRKASGRSDDRPGGDDRRGDRGARKGDRRGTGGRPSVYAIPGDTVFPEGIAVSDRGRARTFFVSSTTDGTIFKGTTKQAAMTPFAPGGADGRTTAAGLKADRRNLFVAGGDTGKAFVLSQKDGSTVKVLDSSPGASPTFINDVVLARKHAYFTDSRRPVILRASTERGRIGELEPWLDLTGTVFEYEDGFNANGIESFDDGRLLVVVQSNTGELFRIDTRRRQVSEIDLGGATVKNGDGLVRKGSRLFVVQNADGRITEVKLRDDKRKGQVRGAITSPTFAFPTTAARDGDRLLVVNAQFDKRGGTPVLPFSVSAVRAKSDAKSGAKSGRRDR